MNETEMLAVGEALARPADLLRPDEQVPLRDYVRRVLEPGEGQLAALFGDGAFVVSVDGRPVDGCDSANCADEMRAGLQWVRRTFL